MMNDSKEVRREIIETCLFLSEKGYFNGTWGNISLRRQEGILITPSRVDYRTMKPEDLVLLSFSGDRIKGNRIASSEKELHRRILEKRSDCSAVIHVHSPNATLVAVMRRSIPVLTEEMAQIIGGEVLCSRYVPGGQHVAFAEAVTEALGDKVMAVLAANHGAVVLGTSLTEAVAAAEVLEKSAWIFAQLASGNNYHVLPDDVVREERERYLTKYGKE